MNWVRIFLWLNAASFVGYGVACLLSPGLAAGYAGFELGDASGTVEIVAMYGGLQIGFGLLIGAGALKPQMEETALWSIAFVVGALCLARIFGMLLHGPSPYNIGAAAYEAVASSLAVVILLRRASTEAAA